MSDDGLQKQRDAVIEATLAHVPFDGWSWKALERGAVDAGHDDLAARRLFLGGLIDAADHFAEWSDRRMLAELENIDLDAMKVRARIHACIKTRIQLNADRKEALRRLLSFLALPHNAAAAARMTWRSCSVMWYASGDRSTDWNHYSKRALLASVYGSTVLYWLSDEGDDSGDFPETWAFLERRIDDVLRTVSLPGRLKVRFDRMPKPFGGAARRFSAKRR